jgi:hypothetical protein
MEFRLGDEKNAIRWLGKARENSLSVDDQYGVEHATRMIKEIQAIRRKKEEETGEMSRRKV